MSAVDEQRQTTAIRAALGTTDAEVTRAPGGGWLVRISDERAKLALDLYDRLGDAATADTFVVSTEDGDQMEGWLTRSEDNTAIPVGFGKTVAEALEGSAADRERYVTERAEFLAAAHHNLETSRPWAKLGPEAAKYKAKAIGRFRDLIDRGVLK